MAKKVTDPDKKKAAKKKADAAKKTAPKKAAPKKKTAPKKAAPRRSLTGGGAPKPTRKAKK